MLTMGTMLGMAVSDRSIAVAEVRTSRGRSVLLRTAEFALPGNGQPRDQSEVGKGLRQFLRQNRFSTSRCLIGLDAGWAIVKEHFLPSSAPDAVTGALSIAAERDFASAAGDYALDYTPPAAVAGGSPALLVAVSQDRLGWVTGLAKAAGLAVTGVGCSALAPAAATKAADAPDRLVLYLRRDGAELVMYSQGSLRVLRRLPAPTPGHPERLAGEVRRLISLLPTVAQPSGGPVLLVWDESGLEEPSLDALRERLGVQVTLCRFPDDLGLAVRTPSEPCQPLTQAAALAVQGLSRQAPALDFLHSRLAPPAKAGLRRRVLLALAAAVVVAAGATWFAVDWQMDSRTVAALQREKDQMSSAVAEAREIVENVSFARGWHDLRPRFLECLREVALAFPEEGRSWATSLALRDDHKVVLTGKSANERAALEVLDRLKNNPRFLDVKPQYIRQAGANTRDVSFAASFDYAGAK